MNELSFEKRCQIIEAIVEGCSIRATARITHTSHKTVLSLLAKVGEACKKFHDYSVVNIDAKSVECDETWSFVFSKQKNLPKQYKNSHQLGDVYCWVAMDADTKLVIGWVNGKRNSKTANRFMKEIKWRLSNRIQLTTDGLKSYVAAIDKTFGAEVDYVRLIKFYDKTATEPERKYSPPKFTGSTKEVVSGMPDLEKASTSHIERQNLTMRMHMRRFTRLTNAFSKKYENHCHSICIYYVYYNFVRIHTTLRVTPAMEAGLTKEPWEIGDIVRLIDVGYIKQLK